MSANRGTKKPDATMLAVMRVIHDLEEKPKAGFKTIDEWGVKWGISRSRARDLILAGLKRGVLTKQDYRRSIKAGWRPQLIAHYGLAVKSRHRRT